jgi:epoxyqueuosine reductase
VCRRCSDACPPQAIPHGAPQDKIENQSNFVGLRKWSVDGEKCFKFWANQGTECGICIRVCPYNKDLSRKAVRAYYAVFRRLAASPLRKFALWMDVAAGFGKRMPPSWWWKSRPGW